MALEEGPPGGGAPLPRPASGGDASAGVSSRLGLTSAAAAAAAAAAAQTTIHWLNGTRASTRGPALCGLGEPQQQQQLQQQQ
ncbi:hypothetical protein ACSSS7_001651 [Eimeria intestinalis]